MECRVSKTTIIKDDGVRRVTVPYESIAVYGKLYNDVRNMSRNQPHCTFYVQCAATDLTHELQQYYVHYFKAGKALLKGRLHDDA
jgi:hypothetical protein